MPLRDMSQLKKENLRVTKAPLSIDLIKEYFENKELFFLVNYEQSDIKGNMFLTYLNNLDLPFEIDLTTTSKEGKFEIIKTYMQTRNIISSNVLTLTVADILLFYVGVPTQDLFQNVLFTNDEKRQFIDENKELIKKWDLFISSSFIYLLTLFPKLKEEAKINEHYDVIDDPSYLGLNVVHLFSVPHFVDSFFSRPLREKMCYFKPQFEEYMFRGKNFYDYFRSEANIYMMLMSCMLRNDQDVEKFLQAAGSIDRAELLASLSATAPHS